MTSRQVIQQRRLFVGSVGALVLLIVGGLVVATVQDLAGPSGDDCTVTGASRSVELSSPQAVAASRLMARADRARSSLDDDVQALRTAERTGLGDHDDARLVARALSGRLEAALACTVDADVAPASTELGPGGLTARAAAVRRDVDAALGAQQVGGFAPGGVSSGHMVGSAHYEGRAVDIFYRPIGPANQVRGWATAQYLVANARRLRVATVIFDDTIWTARRSDEGWRRYRVDTAGRSAATAAILEHRDHVHVDVFG